MKYALTTLFIVHLLAACSSRYGIYKASAYVRETVAGTIRVDDRGRPLNSGVSEEHLLFVETDSAPPVFTTVWVKQKAYGVQPVEIKQPQPSIGKAANGNDVVLQKKEGATLWQLVLTPKEDAAINDASLADKIGQKNIVITGSWKGKPFVYAFDKEERLEPLHFQ
jgi:hypothetical protein